MAVQYTDIAHEQHELACRTNGRYDVVLLFDTTSRELTVSVLDEITGVSFELPVGAEEALEVFHHPFAHPGFRGVALYDDPV
jgi:hypothetical protein